MSTAESFIEAPKSKTWKGAFQVLRVIAVNPYCVYHSVLLERGGKLSMTKVG